MAISSLPRGGTVHGRRCSGGGSGLTDRHRLTAVGRDVQRLDRAGLAERTGAAVRSLDSLLARVALRPNGVAAGEVLDGDTLGR